jgi:hypothetical protein
MTDEFDPNEIVERFRIRAEAVKRRQIPPVEGPERQRFIEAAQQDYFDFALIADSEAVLKDGILTFTVDLRPKPEN